MEPLLQGVLHHVLDLHQYHHAMDLPANPRKEMAWKMGAIVALGSLLLSPFAMLIFEGGHWGLQTVRSLISDDRSLDADLIFY